MNERRRWIVLLCRMPSEPARHRMALWRELRRAGAVPLGQAVWGLPDLPAIQPVLDRARELITVAHGDLLVLSASGYDEAAAIRLDELYATQREQEWTEFLGDCAKYLAELDKEEATAKFTLAELEEEEQSLDRLRRWYRDLRARDLLGTSAAGEADLRLKECARRLDDYAEQVYTAVTDPDPGAESGPGDTASC
ncbi:MAG: chromate resistance protein ChrB [Actinobacteria bacterium]|nr:chromate resistance protein ChrB [Actinomycetota bacterium]